jgi:DNA-binding response OmpR family regulator
MNNIEEHEKERLLVLEDDPAILRANAELLEKAGYRVDCGEDGEAGWEAICAHRYDLVITDQQMPRLSGLELLARMRAIDIRTPVILVSGSFELDPRADDLFEAVLHKPSHLYELLDAVRRALAQGHHEPARRAPLLAQAPTEL